MISTTPVAGTTVKRDTAVSLIVSKGQAPATVPSFVGQQLSAALAAATKAHLKLDSSAPGQYSSTVAQGAVISQDTKPGTVVPRGTTVQVVVSLGPPLVTVPDVFSMNRNKAKQLLEKAGFKVSFYEPYGVTPFNQVYTQSPGAGSKAPLGSTIRLGIF